MLFSTPTQFIVLALALVAGWLLGLASHPGGRKWKDRYATEREAHAAVRRDAEVKLAESNRQVAEARRGTDDRLIQANTRIAELESDNARLGKATPVASTPELPGDTPVYASTMSRPALSRQRQTQGSANRGWFDWA